MTMNKVYASVNSVQGKIKTQEGIDKLVQWTHDWQIQFNSGKCKVLPTGEDNPEYNYYIWMG